MAKISDHAPQGNWISPEELHREGAIFSITNAVKRETGKFGANIVYTIYITEDEESDPVEKQFSLAFNDARAWWVEHFKNPDAEPFEACELQEVKTKQGRTAWNIKDADTE